MRIGYWCDIKKERDYPEERIILKLFLDEQNRMLQKRLIWLRIETGGRIL
jgi:hypothetical protein